MTDVTDAEIDRLHARYRALQDQVRQLDFIAVGSVIERYTRAAPRPAAATPTRPCATAPTSNTAASSKAKPSPDA